MKKIFIASCTFALSLGLSGTAFATAIDTSNLPIGDGKISTSPKAGYIYSCRTAGGGGGAEADGPWIHGTTWNLKEKIAVQGAVSWPTAFFAVDPSNGTSHSLSGNGLPVGSQTGVFPISSSDPAYQYDRNPNTIKSQSISYVLPSSPTIAATPSCVPMGIIGVALNGVAIFNGLDGENRDAVAHEVQDGCGGHPERSGQYHYHGPSTCIPHQSENNALIGYALDGFGIYSGYDANGAEISTADLDECHGTTSPVVWDGKKVSMYHYVLTKDYPYTIGCFKGNIATANTSEESSGSKGAGANPQTSEMTPTNNFQIRSDGLSYGSRGDDVVALQTLLEKNGYLKMPQGIAKGYFGAMTKNALKKYQRDNGINPTGFFGPITKKYVNEKAKSDQGKPSSNMPLNPMMGASGPGLGGPPPQEAIAACSGKIKSAACSFASPTGETIFGSCQSPAGSQLACVPANR